MVAGRLKVWNELAGEWEYTPGGDSGGSQPGISVVDYLFTEVATAGVYTAPTLDLLENSYLIDVQWWRTDASSGDWAADTAALDVVDSAVGSLVGAQDVKGGSVDVPISAAQSIALVQPYVFPNLTNNAEVSGGGTITTTVTTTVESPPATPAAVMLVRLIYVTAPTPSAAVFA